MVTQTCGVWLVKMALHIDTPKAINLISFVKKIVLPCQFTAKSHIKSHTVTFNI